MSSGGVYSLCVDLTSYNKPDATVKMLISACLCVDTPVSALLPDDLNTDEMLSQGISSTHLTGLAPRNKVATHRETILSTIPVGSSSSSSGPGVHPRAPGPEDALGADTPSGPRSSGP